MQIQVHYSHVKNTEWVENFLRSKTEKLGRYLTSSANLQVHLKNENNQYTSTIVFYDKNADLTVSASSENLYESFTIAVNKAMRILGEQKRRVKDRIKKNYFSMKKSYAS